MAQETQPRKRDDIHIGFINFYKKRNIKPPKISKWLIQFTAEEFNRFAAACEESAINAKRNGLRSSLEQTDSDASIEEAQYSEPPMDVPDKSS